MKKTPRLLLRSLLALLALCFTSSAFAAAGIQGIITDVTGKPVYQCTVKALQGRNLMATTLSDARGHYTINQLKPGSYTLSFSYRNLSGVVNNVMVGAMGTVTVNTTLLQGKVGRADDALATPKMEQIKLKDEKKALAAKPVEEREMIAYDKVSPPASAQQYSVGAISRQGNFSVMAPPYYNPSTEDYKKDPENDFKTVQASPLSTLSVDVDRASYSNVRRFINQGQKPPADAVRIEEMINYFNYNYTQPTGNAPVAITSEVTACPWNPENKLLHIGLQAKKINAENLPPSNLVFLIDVSGSMSEPNKLPLLKSSFNLLVDNLREKDRVAIVVYAGNAGLVLPATKGSRKNEIREALEQLSAGGSTAGGEGIELAYKTAEDNFIKGGNNHIILATDGDFNVGVSNNNELEDLITKKRNKGIFLTCLGFGMGNYKDSKMEVLADKGNGNYAYIDNIQEAQKTLVSEFGSTLFTVAKDVKAQVEFNPAKVQGYRLVGYENRLLNAEDFKDDTKDAAEMGAGHTVTILYELIPAGVKSKSIRGSDALKYQQTEPRNESDGGEIATVKFRYKAPDGNVSKELVQPIEDGNKALIQTSSNIRFAAAVAMWGMLLKDSKYKGKASYEKAILLAESARGTDADGYRAECIRLMKSAPRNESVSVD